ncbi:N/A [soil metagenome]
MTHPHSANRAAGTLLGLAAGDALGAGYEFGPPLLDDASVGMIGGGTFDWAPGEWTDDTSMAIPIARVLVGGGLDTAFGLLDQRNASGLDEIVSAWASWARDAKDVGTQTRAVLGLMNAPTATNARAAAKAVHDHTGRSGGNGSLMRTAPVALAYLDDPVALAEAARTISDLTHYEQDAGDACVLWSMAIRHAVLTGELHVRVGIRWLDADRQQRWRDIIDVAEQRQPRDFENNGWVVEALQGAWSAIHHSTGFADAVERAVRGGRDTDTVAAIAGSLAGAAAGADGIPQQWRDIVHGWPGLRGEDLAELAEAIVSRR